MAHHNPLYLGLNIPVTHVQYNCPSFHYSISHPLGLADMEPVPPAEHDYQVPDNSWVNNFINPYTVLWSLGSGLQTSNRFVTGIPYYILSLHDIYLIKEFHWKSEVNSPSLHYLPSKQKEVTTHYKLHYTKSTIHMTTTHMTTTYDYYNTKLHKLG